MIETAPAVLTIRPAVFGDLDEITDLESRSFPAPWKREFFESEIDAEFRLNLVARAPDGRFAGYVFCAWVLDEIHVHKIAVQEEWRRSGLGTALMKEVIAFGLRNDSYQIFLEVRPSNTPAKRMYQKLGFEISGRRKAYYPDGEDAIVMVRELHRS
ncbi:MAG: ribosomal protein S18-alanine N-acetyltransferase [Acidobacteria bacterium]|nr:ribosomal protein S18-alanine N-acetyltransferase [Acidobacteriota bacterium]MCG3190848.1 Ribosomal-protein-alanine acetyltransferase [Thermoanaerobaculia bacterium]MCK6684512.1 ribosomal protein S18-alanine N-acetyltransferase [Thermoanaerobaculia bacterium]